MLTSEQINHEVQSIMDALGEEGNKSLLWALGSEGTSVFLLRDMSKLDGLGVIAYLVDRFSINPKGLAEFLEKTKTLRQEEYKKRGMKVPLEISLFDPSGNGGKT